MMIVPATRLYLTERQCRALCAGCRVDIDSGMGGSFPLRFVSWNQQRDQGLFVVDNTQSSFHMQEYTVNLADMPSKLYYLVAENPNFR